jgi:predicted RNA-binding Zn ribbon-like protein
VTLPDWVPGPEEKPAPMPLLLVQAFVNTSNLGEETDLLADDTTANTWLRQAGLLGAEFSAAGQDLQAAREVREGIRALLAANGGGPPATDAGLRPLQAVTFAAQPRLTVDHDGQVQLEPESRGRPADGLVRLLLIIRDAQHDGTWPRLKACGNPDCQWAFYDRSHSRRGTWCDMSSCGNLIKNRNLRARRSSQPSAAQPAAAAAAAAQP